MKVKELLNDLKRADPEANIVVASSSTNELTILSVYSAAAPEDDDGAYTSDVALGATTVCIDVEEKD